MPRRNNERALTLFISPELMDWLDDRAAKNQRARLREAVTILEAERAREARQSAPGVLNAQAGAGGQQ